LGVGFSSQGKGVVFVELLERTVLHIERNGTDFLRWASDFQRKVLTSISDSKYLVANNYSRRDLSQVDMVINERMEIQSLVVKQQMSLIKTQGL
jgi:hypothetical protein